MNRNQIYLQNPQRFSENSVPWKGWSVRAGPLASPHPALRWLETERRCLLGAPAKFLRTSRPQKAGELGKRKPVSTLTLGDTQHSVCNTSHNLLQVPLTPRWRGKRQQLIHRLFTKGTAGLRAGKLEKTFETFCSR